MNGLDLLRWVLLIIGVVILLGVYAAGRRSLSARLRRRRAERADAPQIEAEADAATLTVPDPELAELGRSIRLDEPEDVPVQTESTAPVTAERPRSDPAAQPSSPRHTPRDATSMPAPEPKIVVVYVVATSGGTYRGPDIFAAAETADLDYGDMRIFHRYETVGGAPEPVFGVASMVEPGWFDQEQIEELETPGLALFLQLPAPIEGVKAFDAMIGAAQSLKRSLGGELRDASRSIMSLQTIAHLRDEVSDYERMQRTRSGALR